MRNDARSRPNPVDLAVFVSSGARSATCSQKRSFSVAVRIFDGGEFRRSGPPSLSSEFVMWPFLIGPLRKSWISQWCSYLEDQRPCVLESYMRSRTPRAFVTAPSSFAPALSPFVCVSSVVGGSDPRFRFGGDVSLYGAAPRGLIGFYSKCSPPKSSLKTAQRSPQNQMIT